MKLTIKSRPDSFCRSGVRFSGSGTEIDTDKFTLEQLKAIRDEPNLACPSDLDKAIAEHGKPKKPEGDAK
ncbi:hypothetical protein HC761_00695 [bacterium]|nr:hypothetical protein [bacterium]